MLFTDNVNIINTHATQNIPIPDGRMIDARSKTAYEKQMLTIFPPWYNPHQAGKPE